MKKNNKGGIEAEYVAKWMFKKINKEKELYHEDVVYQIEEKFGSDFVYYNQDGNLAISKEVLKEFRKLTEPTVVWSRSELCWKYRSKDDPKTGRMVE
jgi:hypothetical protein